MPNKPKSQIFSVKPPICDSLALLKALETGKISGETRGWLTPEDVRIYFSQKAVDNRP